MTFHDAMLGSVGGFLSAFGEELSYSGSGTVLVMDGSLVMDGDLVMGGGSGTLTGMVERGAAFGDMDAIKAFVEIPLSSLTGVANGDVIVTELTGESWTVHEGPGARIDHDGVWWKIPMIRDERGSYRGRRR